MNVPRALVSFLVAALVPETLGALTNLGTSRGFLYDISMFGIIYLFIAPVVLCVGFVSLAVALKVKYGPIIIPPIVGAATGTLLTIAMYSQGYTTDQLMQFIVAGVLTALVGAGIYFYFPKRA